MSLYRRPRHTEDQTNSESTGPDPDASEEDPEGAEESKQLALAQAVALFTSLVRNHCLVYFKHVSLIIVIAA